MATSELFHDVYSCVQFAVLNARRSAMVIVHPEGTAHRLIVSARVDPEIIESIRDLNSQLVIINGKVTKNVLREDAKRYFQGLCGESNRAP